MAEQYDNELKFALFRNTKTENPKAPQYKGTVQIDGKKYWLSAWKKTSKSGEPYLSGAAQLAEDEQPKRKPAPTPMADLEDDVPF